MNRLSTFVRVCLTSVCVLAAGAAQADRVKDLATLAAQRPNQLIGYGLVVGLQGTGDDASVPFTTQSMKAMLSQMGVRIDGPLTDFETAATAARVDIKNTAAVLVTADLPGFAKPGQKIDVNVSAIGKASSLRGGNLILTSLRGVDGEIYGIAQGALTATGVETSAAGSKVSIGVPTSARISGGATVERLVDNPFEKASHVVMNVRESDFTTTSAIVNAINKNFGDGTAQAIDGMSLAVKAPTDLSQRVNFLSMIENLDVQPGDRPGEAAFLERLQQHPPQRRGGIRLGRVAREDDQGARGEQGGQKVLVHGQGPRARQVLGWAQHTMRHPVGGGERRVGLPLIKWAGRDLPKRIGRPEGRPMR